MPIPNCFPCCVKSVDVTNGAASKPRRGAIAGQAVAPEKPQLPVAMEEMLAQDEVIPAQRSGNVAFVSVAPVFSPGLSRVLAAEELIEVQAAGAQPHVIRPSDPLVTVSQLVEMNCPFLYDAEIAMPDGTVQRAYFKVLRDWQPEAGGAAGLTFLDVAKKSRQVRCNLTTCAVAKLLGLAFCVETRIGIGKMPDGSFRIGLVMPQAKGMQADCTPSAPFSHPKLMEDLLALQLLDLLMAQKDRTVPNYLIDVDDRGEPEITAIDHDKCLDTWTLERLEKEPVARVVRMAPVVVSAMAYKILNLAPEALKDCLEEWAVPDGEVAAELGRLQELKDRISAMDARGAVIAPAELSLELLTDCTTSYVGRDVLAARKYELFLLESARTAHIGSRDEVKV